MDRLIKSVANLLLLVAATAAVSSALIDGGEPDSDTLFCLLILFVMPGLGLAATLCEGILETLLFTALT
jgi:hypothetical protein